MADMETRVLKVGDVDMLDSAIWKVQGVQHLLSEWSSALQLRGGENVANAFRVLDETLFGAWGQLSEVRPKVYDTAGMTRLKKDRAAVE